MLPLLVLFELLSPPSAWAGEGEDARSLMLGAQLAVTAEPQEVGGTTVGLNVAPLVVEWALHPRLGLRGSSTLNLQLGGPEGGLSHRGGALTLPVYLGARGPTAGIAVGPSVGFTRNPLVDGSDLTLAAEADFRWAFAERFSFNLAVQLGASHLDRPQESRWVNHLGVYPSVGVWIF